MYQWALRDISIAQTVEQRYEPEYDVELMEFLGGLITFVGEAGPLSKP